MALVLSSRMATLAELQTVYSAADLYTMYEVAAVEAHNRALASLPTRRRGDA